MAARVWAPEAAALAIEIEGRRYPMLPEGEPPMRYWSLDGPKDLSGDYGFLIDGQGPFPDPRSPWQPDGVHGPSRKVDHGAFAWSDKNWRAPELSSGLIYEMHVGTFTPAGTFDGAIKRLDYLAELGVTHLEIMPVAQFPGSRGWGYDGVDLFAPHQAYGGPDGLKRLVDACHARGLAVLLDVVYNHFGPAGNYLPRFGPYLTDRYRTPWGAAVNLDGPGSDEVRRFLCDNALGWLTDYHFDGLRLDAAHALFDYSPLHFLEQLAAEVAQMAQRAGRRLVLIAESDSNDPRLVTAPEAGGYGLDAEWNDDFHHALHCVLTGERNGYYQDFGTLAQLAQAIRKVYVYDGIFSQFRGRHHGRPAHGLSGTRFVGFLQNHDQIGNRALGERTAHLMSQGRLKIGAALMLTAPFVPLLFQGEEWGASTPFLYFTSHPDAELGRAIREGRRREFVAFGWDTDNLPDPQAPATFVRSKLDWRELAREPHRELLNWYRDLIALRANYSELHDGRLDLIDVAFDERARWITIARGALTVACNLAATAQDVPLGGAMRVIMASDSAIAPRAADRIAMPADSVAILSARG